MTNKVELLTGYVLVRELPATESQSKLLSLVRSGTPTRAAVVAVGKHYFSDGTWTQMGISVDDVVLYPPDIGIPFVLGNETLRLVQMSQLIAIEVE